jgi:hypothetical protein
VADDLPAAIIMMSCASTPTARYTRAVDLHESRWNFLSVCFPEGVCFENPPNATVQTGCADWRDT